NMKTAFGEETNGLFFSFSNRMRTGLTILSVLLLYTGTVLSQTVKLSWANAMPGNSYDVCRAIALDNENNIYATGYFSTTVDFDAGPNTFNLTAVNAEDIFLAKYDPAGKLIWAKTMGDFRYQAGYAITLDNAGNIYLTGIFFGATDFDPGPGIAQMTSAGNEDIFVCKYDNNGNYIWAKQLGGTTNDYCNAIKLDGEGNIYINGYFDGVSDFDPGPGVFNLVSNGATDIFVCKLNNNGALVWAKSIGGPSSDVAYSIGLDEQDNVYSTGFYWATVDFNPGPGVFNLSSDAQGDGYMLKLNKDGSFIKAGKMGGNSRVRAISLKLDKTDHMYIAGHFDGTADFDPGTGIRFLNSPIDDDDIFVAKFDLDFNLVWVKQIGGPSYQQMFDMDCDDADLIYLTGHYNGTADFDPGPGIYNLTATGDPDIFVLKLTAGGEFVWVANSTGPFYGSGYTLKTDAKKNIYVGGTFEGTKDFDPGPDELKHTSAGQSEIFMLKLQQCPNAAIAQTLNINTCTSYTLNNKRYDSTGTYTHLVLNAMGCDSINITLNLTISRIINTVNANICQGEFYMAAGKLRNKTGIYYDTLKTSAGCDSVTITNLIVQDKPDPKLGSDRNICKGQNIILIPGSFNSYLWQDGSAASQYTVAAPGTYTVTVTNQYCKASARIVIRNIVPLPADFLPKDQDLCTGNVLKINVPGYRSYTWNTGASTPGLDIRTAGNYYLTVTNFDNCVGTDTLNIREINCIPIGIPNAFTPNNDGKNDLFKPGINFEITNYHLQVYNRVGQLIYQTKDQGQGWDGRFKGQQQSSDNYIYQVNFRNMEGKLFEYRGNIILLR
ncbi:MAG: T9SS type B sorting domain-containing protein, partial [Ferruginibacter sp.]